jgi:phage-related minor tail protein
MTDEPTSGVDLGAFQLQLSEAAAALAAFAEGPARAAADDVAASFERAGVRIATALGRAALGGETSFKQMVKTILEELAKVALDRLFAQSSSVPLFGARATGGSVNVGGAYLVGERGPELFVPRQAGEVASAATGAITVNFNFASAADVSVVTRNQGQIAAALARAVAYGRRNL